MKTTIIAAAILFSTTALAQDVTGTGKYADTPASGASRSTTGTITEPGSSPAVHDEEFSKQNVTASLEQAGFEDIENLGTSSKEDRKSFTADAARDDQKYRIDGQHADKISSLTTLEAPRLAKVLESSGYTVGQMTVRDEVHEIQVSKVSGGLLLFIDGKRNLIYEAQPVD